MAKTDVVPVTVEDVQSFSKKLDAWGKGLAPKERALLQVMVERATGGGSKELSEEALETVAGGALQLGGSFSTQLSGIFGPALKTGFAASGWVEAGDPWVQGASLPGIEKIRTY